MIQATQTKQLLESSSMEANTAQSKQMVSTQYNRAMKLALDYALALPGLLLIAPLFIFLAILVKLDSPGPVFHRRRVLGKDGRIFYAFKFRTMYVNGDEILARYP